jgi:prepilin-type N-terminal cleavage/methylation domain-containing protein
MMIKRGNTVTLKARYRGFTLAEIAIVILIMGIALSMGLKLANVNLENAAYSETRSKQELVKQALIGFLRANGRLPCPDTAAGLATGVESACSGVGAAPSGYGVVPWQTLGISRDSALDGWGNLFTYRVSNVTLGAATLPFAGTPLHRFQNQDWTLRPLGFDIRSIAAAPIAPGYQSVLIQNREPGPALSTESRNAIVVLVSHGKNGFGAKTIKAAARIAGAANDELTNATLGSLTFVRRGFSENAPVASGGPYDDVVTYMTPQDLLQPLITEKTLIGTCQAYCGTPAVGCPPVAIPIGSTPVTCP